MDSRQSEPSRRRYPPPPPPPTRRARPQSDSGVARRDLLLALGVIFGATAGWQVIKGAFEDSSGSLSPGPVPVVDLAQRRRALATSWPDLSRATAGLAYKQGILYVRLKTGEWLRVLTDAAQPGFLLFVSEDGRWGFVRTLQQVNLRDRAMAISIFGDGQWESVLQGLPLK
ncbi:hypothetical protein WJX72_010563 [[Myrmecia] bisecta]|uniref:Uncharacterized protein n=1 Tax=[Myrmecia] bisecta TaxID=41462 RepID=A0AAW1PM68_9CHLO